MATTMIRSLAGANVVVTGRIPGHTRRQVEARLSAAGAHIQSGVTQATSVLIIGDDEGGTKVRAAAKWGTPTITWGQAEELLESGTAAAPTGPPQPAARSGGPVSVQHGYRQIKPMKCGRADDIPRGEEWTYEMKWDGFRGVATLDGNGGVILASGQGKDFTKRFSLIVDDLREITVPCILDGEICVLDDKGHTSFESMTSGSARFVVFDVLEANGTSIMAEPFKKRRELLELIVDGTLSRVTASPLFDDGDALLAYAEANELEGVVAKNVKSRYVEGQRGNSWQKIKLRTEQEFVVIGYTEGQGARAGTAGALILAYFDASLEDTDHAGWVYAGKAGSGGKYRDYEEIVSKTAWGSPGSKPLPEFLRGLDHDFSRADLKEVTWVNPEVLVQVAFQKWTSDGRLWHPSIKGIRDDKEPKEVTKES